jgi:hypothetical protein
MTFVQVIEFQGSADEVIKKGDEYEARMAGSSTARRVLLLEDRDRPGTLVQLVWFDSYESAMENSNNPATQEFAADMMASFGEATFRNLEVREDRDLS